MKNLFSLIGTILLAGLLYFTIGMSSYESDFENLEYFASFEGKNLYEEFKNEIDAINLTQDEKNSENQESISTNKNDINLSLVDIYLEQGEEGVKTWEMEAEWANYAERTGNLFAYKPDIIYFDKNNNEAENVHITGKTGKVLENNTLLTLTDDVEIKKNTMQLSGIYAEFLPNDEKASMPKGALLQADETIGRAQTIDWDMLKNDIQAKGNVVFILNNDDKTFKLDDARKNPPTI